MRHAHCRGPPALTSAATPRASNGTPDRAERPAAEPATHAPHARPARAQHAAKPARQAEVSEDVESMMGLMDTAEEVQQGFEPLRMILDCMLVLT